MSQKLVITEVSGYGLTDEIASAYVEDEVRGFCEAMGLVGTISYSYDWLEFGVADENGSTGECDTDTFIGTEEIGKFLEKATDVREVIEWLEDEKGYKVDVIESGHGTVDVEDDAPCEPDYNEDEGFDPYSGSYTWDC